MNKAFYEIYCDFPKAKGKRLLEAYEVRDIRELADGEPNDKGWWEGRAVEFGILEKTVAKRKTFCRACGGDIPKGEERLSFQWDFTGSGSWTLTGCHIHYRDCQAEVQPPKEGKR